MYNKASNEHIKIVELVKNLKFDGYYKVIDCPFNYMLGFPSCIDKDYNSNIVNYAEIMNSEYLFSTFVSLHIGTNISYSQC